MLSTVEPQKLCTLTTRPFLLNLSCIIYLKWSPYNDCCAVWIFSLLFSFVVCCYSLTIFVFSVFEFIEFFFLLSNHFFKLVLHRFFEEVIIYVFLVGDNNFVIGICYLIIVVTNIFGSN